MCVQFWRCVFTKYLCVCLCATCLDPYIKWLYNTLQRGVFFSTFARQRALAVGAGGFSQKPSQALLMHLHWAIWWCALSPRCSGKQKVYYYTWFALICLLYLLEALHLKNQCSHTCHHTSSCTWINNREWVCFVYVLLQGFWFICIYTLLTAVIWKGREEQISHESGVIFMLNTICNHKPMKFVGSCQTWLGMRVNAGVLFFIHRSATILILPA